ncbi:Na+/H+ antiporter NhaC family protein [Aerococcus sp. UMB1112A]|uniref:YfcC family protein n=1 Tax=Aerococcus sp. UMB1112A TaxID=3050609 RepID=UPI00254DD1EC|nr:Na+/H+ antiporter NhaC family protein [Aerococcus sp. UMB1112A]MDK8502364.1 Na+/H+ antiporter NhaC family protein [Aerococcus sp. UMB1112A]
MSRLWSDMRELRVPHTYVLLFAFIVIAALMSWVVPAGEFARTMVDGREVIDPNSFRYVAQQPQGIFDILKSLPAGFERSQHISYFLFIVGGAFGVMNQTGAIEAALSRLVHALRGKETLVIPSVLLIMGIAGSTIGLSEETILFIALGVTLARGMGYDALVGVGMIGLGAGLGFTSGFMNPFSVGVAQSIADLPLFSGIGLRLVLFAVVWLSTTVYLMRYAKKVKADPSQSIVYEEEQAAKAEEASEGKTSETLAFTRRQQIIAAIFVLSFVVIAVGVIGYGWYITEIGAGILAGMVGGLKAGQIADGFIEGAKDMVYAALIVGLAQSLIVILEDGMIIDTLIHAMSDAIANLPSVLSAVGIYVVQVIINFFISSGSGQAAVTMPIIVPLADALGVTRQTAVLCYQLGNGFLDSIMPMSGILMAQLAIAKIPYSKWVKFAMPLMLIWLLIGLVFVIAAHLMGYGPF